MNKAHILQALDAFIRQRPGLDFGNYGDVTSYRAEVRGIGKDLQDARTLLQAVTWRDSITAEAIIDASKHAFSGRLTIEAQGDSIRVDYCTGQYWPTEYRKAVCAVLASALWAYWREQTRGPNQVNTAADIRRIATKELGRGIAARWFR